MQVKLFEIRDRGTFIPVMAIHLIIDEIGEVGDAEFFLLRRAGYNQVQILNSMAEPYIILSKLDGVKAHYDPFEWDSTTMRDAHRYMVDNWRELTSGDVLDVEFIRGDSQVPKKSERFN